MRIRTLCLVSALCVAAGTTLALPAQAADAPRVTESAAWGTVPSPNRGSLDNALKGLAAVAPDDIWAVGEYNPGIPPTATGRRTLAEHWDGSRWRLVKTQDPTWEGLDYSTLEDVDEIASNDVWAVGYSQDFGSFRQNTLVEHWDGTAWRIIPSPNPAGINKPNTLYGVEAISSNDVWALGEAGVDHRSLILHWNGTAWVILANGCGFYAQLRGIDAVSPTDIWAVGDATTCHYDGVSWSLVPSPQPRPEYYEIAYPLEAVSAAAPDDIWAVGARVTDNGWYIDFSGFAEHWDGTKWTAVYYVGGSQLFDVEAINSADAWTVGTANPGSLVQHWNGLRWKTIPSPDRGYGGTLQAIEPAGTDLWAAGSWYGSPGGTFVLQAPSKTQGTVVGDTDISYAVVSWFGRVNGSTETDPLGRYDAPGLPAGTYQFVASYGGCQPDTAQVEVVAGTTVVQDLHPKC